MTIMFTYSCGCKIVNRHWFLCFYHRQMLEEDFIKMDNDENYEDKVVDSNVI